MSGWTAPESGWYDFALARKPRKISEDAWTAPEDGWYELGGGEPRKLSDEEVSELGAVQAIPDMPLVQFGTDETGTAAWSISTGSLTLPNGQVIPGRARTIVLDTVPYEG